MYFTGISSHVDAPAASFNRDVEAAARNRTPADELTPTGTQATTYSPLGPTDHPKGAPQANRLRARPKPGADR